MTHSSFPLNRGVLCSLFLLLSCAVGCTQSEGKANEATAKSAPIRARVIEVAEQTWPQSVATQGNLIADETTVVGAKVAGRVEVVSVDIGDVVTKGTVLASLDRMELQEQVRQAEAELTQVRAAIGLDADDNVDELNPNASPIVVEQKALWDQASADRERLESLRTSRAATAAQLESAIATEKVAQARHASAINSVRQNIALVRVRTAQLSLARQALDDAEIRAPFDGRIQERHVAPGTYIQVGDPVVVLIRDDPLRYQGTVPEIYASRIKIGQRIQLRVSTDANVPEVTISRISPALDPYSRALLFEAVIPNQQHAIQAGQFAQGEVVLDESRRALSLPESAIVEFAGTQKVWKVVEGQSVEQSVETGARRGNLVEILSGIEAGDRVLVDGSGGRPAAIEIEELLTTAGRAENVNLERVSVAP